MSRLSLLHSQPSHSIRRECTRVKLSSCNHSEGTRLTLNPPTLLTTLLVAACQAAQAQDSPADPSTQDDGGCSCTRYQPAPGSMLCAAAALAHAGTNIQPSLGHQCCGLCPCCTQLGTHTAHSYACRSRALLTPLKFLGIPLWLSPTMPTMAALAHSSEPSLY